MAAAHPAEEAIADDYSQASGSAPIERASEDASGAASQAAEYGFVDEGGDDSGAGTSNEGEPDGGDSESLAEATLIEPRGGPEAEQRAYEEAVVGDHSPALADAPQERSEWAPAAHEEAPQDEDFSPFADDDQDDRGRRPLVTMAILALFVAALAALFWFTAPDSWKARVGLPAGGSSQLALVTTHMDRQRLESGNELLTVTGRVINPTGEEQSVPPLQAQLKSATGKVVYRWTIAPPAQSLAPGASASFNSAEVNVPPGGEEITLTLGASKP